MYPRRHILEDNSLAHVYFRCHNRSHLLEPAVIKRKLLELMAKYKKRYNVKIFEFIIMDNHAHFIMRAGTVENLGNFMRTVNSQLAQKINSHFGRDSQAIRERFRSPLIATTHYLLEAIQYIFANRYKINRKCPPDKDPFCSAYWRIRRPFKKVENPITDAEKRESDLADLLDDVKELNIGAEHSERNFIEKLVQCAMEKVDDFIDSFFEGEHTVADPETVKTRGTMLSGKRRRKGPAPPP